MKTGVSEYEGGGESELESIVVVRGGRVGNFRGFFLDHEPCLFFLFNKFSSLPNQSLASIYDLSLITALIVFFRWGYMLLGHAQERVATPRRVP